MALLQLPLDFLTRALFMRSATLCQHSWLDYHQIPRLPEDQAMSQKPRFMHSAPLTTDALARLFKALSSCETTREAMNEARAILAELGSARGVDQSDAQ